MDFGIRSQKCWAFSALGIKTSTWGPGLGHCRSCKRPLQRVVICRESEEVQLLATGPQPKLFADRDAGTVFNPPLCLEFVPRSQRARSHPGPTARIRRDVNLRSRCTYVQVVAVAKPRALKSLLFIPDKLYVRIHMVSYHLQSCPFLSYPSLAHPIPSSIPSRHIVPYKNISPHSKTHHIKPYHIISYHIISYHIISYHIISYHIISYHIISYHITSYHIISYHIISYHVIAFRIMS